MTLKIGHMSDLHAGFSPNTVKIHDKWFKNNQNTLNQLDILILAGDLASNSTHQINTLLSTIRKYTQIPIAVVFGNHDFWTKPKKNIFPQYEDIVQRQQEILKKHNISYLTNKPLIMPITTHKRLVIQGYDGWYGKSRPPTNDDVWMANLWQTTPPNPHDFLRNKADRDFNNILNDYEDLDENDYKILVTHFPPMVLDGGNWARVQSEMCGIRSHMPEIAERYDMCLMGHFHGFYDMTVGRCRFLTTGSDYDKLVLKVYEVGE